MKTLVLAICLTTSSFVHLHGAIVLSGTSYTETFDDLESGLPSGWTVATGATSDSLGTAATFSGTEVSWGSTAAGFRNVASADGLTAGATVAQQAASTDRALGIRQGAAFGDPGAAFVVTINDTVGFGSFTVSFKAQMLSVQDRSTVWTIDYRIGDGAFSALGTFLDPNEFGSTTMSFELGTAWDNLSSSIDLRIVALSPSTGSNNRDTFAIDDFTLEYASVIPESTNLSLALFASGAFIVLLYRRFRR